MARVGVIRFGGVVLQYIFGVFLFIAVGSLPVLLRDLSFDIEGYFVKISELSVKIFTLSNLTYDGTHDMLPAVMDRFFHSLMTLGTAFFTALAFALLLSYLIVLFFEGKKDYILSFIEIIRAVPDVLWMFLLQVFFIWIYKTFGLKLVQTVSLGSNQAFLLPLISLSLPIFLFLTQVMVLKIFEELDKQYVIFAKSKGLSSIYLLNIHVIRNISQDMLGHFKTIIWMMLSTLVMVEYIFNLNGLMLFNIKYVSIELFVLSSILFFTAFFILYRLIDLRSGVR